MEVPLDIQAGWAKKRADPTHFFQCQRLFACKQRLTDPKHLFHRNERTICCLRLRLFLCLLYPKSRTRSKRENWHRCETTKFCDSFFQLTLILSCNYLLKAENKILPIINKLDVKLCILSISKLIKADSSPRPMILPIV